jgi:hypothetical protein
MSSELAGKKPAVYALAIHPDAEREWGKLDEAIKRRFKQKLQKERLMQPRVTKDALHGAPSNNSTRHMPQRERFFKHRVAGPVAVGKCQRAGRRGSLLLF